MSQPTITTHTIRRAAYTTPRAWDDVVHDLRTAGGRVADTHTPWWPEGTDAASVTHSIKSRVGPAGFFFFVEHPHSQLFALFAPTGAFCPRVSQFIVGDPLTAARVYQETPRVALLAPLRFAVIELPDGRGTEIVYDVPTSVIAGESGEASQISEAVDVKLEKYVRSVL